MSLTTIIPPLCPHPDFPSIRLHAPPLWQLPASSPRLKAKPDASIQCDPAALPLCTACPATCPNHSICMLSCLIVCPPPPHVAPQSESHPKSRVGGSRRSGRTGACPTCVGGRSGEGPGSKSCGRHVRRRGLRWVGGQGANCGTRSREIQMRLRPLISMVIIGVQKAAGGTGRDMHVETCRQGKPALWQACLALLLHLAPYHTQVDSCH